MIALPVVCACKTKEELIKQVKEVGNALVQFYKELPDELFSSPAIPDGWSIEKNMKHIVKSNNGLGLWIGLPKSVLKMRGTPNKEQPPVQELRPTNRPELFDYGQYAEPSKPNPFQKDFLLKRLRHSFEKLIPKIEHRTEEELDTLPGLFGGMSLRTFVYFLLKHSIHHTSVVRVRVANSVR